MTEDLMRYDILVEGALRAVVREALIRVAAEGLPGDHHLYITFRTEDPGVSLPEYLREKYPAEMTIVLQHQFRDLTVDEAGFSVSLSFNDVDEQLAIPFVAVTAFADPLVNFGLQFKFEDEGESGADSITGALEQVKKPADNTAPPQDNAAAEPAAAEDGDNVITLDTFRKK